MKRRVLGFKHPLPVGGPSSLGNSDLNTVMSRSSYLPKPRGCLGRNNFHGMQKETGSEVEKLPSIS